MSSHSDEVDDQYRSAHLASRSARRKIAKLVCGECGADMGAVYDTPYGRLTIVRWVDEVLRPPDYPRFRERTGHRWQAKREARFLFDHPGVSVSPRPRKCSKCHAEVTPSDLQSAVNGIGEQSGSRKILRVPLNSQ